MRHLRFMIFAVCLSFPFVKAGAAPNLGDPERTALISAIEDEIYDYGLQGNFRDVGRELSGDRFEIPLYVTSDSTASAYFVIYRLMPYGEMYRMANIATDGTVELLRNPKIGFPPDSPATSTAYYDDDDICKSKHEALRLTFVVEMNPSKQRIKEAIQAQKKRYGFSNLEGKRQSVR